MSPQDAFYSPPQLCRHPSAMNSFSVIIIEQLKVLLIKFQRISDTQLHLVFHFKGDVFTFTHLGCVEVRC